MARTPLHLQVWIRLFVYFFAKREKYFPNFFFSSALSYITFTFDVVLYLFIFVYSKETFNLFTNKNIGIEKWNIFNDNTILRGERETILQY